MGDVNRVVMELYFEGSFLPAGRSRAHMKLVDRLPFCKRVRIDGFENGKKPIPRYQRKPSFQVDISEIKGDIGDSPGSSEAEDIPEAAA